MPWVPEFDPVPSAMTYLPALVVDSLFVGETETSATPVTPEEGPLGRSLPNA